ncbi:spherulin 4-like cell surface protein [Cadophora sp. MPI-SDFR-AT-0126]|nr:spherulin 4-like cell surface protein [Leotiomycetes sp. MPI-SDFR-AT-0126]
MALIPTSPRKRRWWIILLSAFVLAIIVAIIVPLAIILPRKGEERHHSTILLPLYIYPETNSSWMPLFRAIESRPQLKFIVVVNPSSGPGSTTFPDVQYSSEIEKLNSYQNVQTIGYVRTDYANRNITTVLFEISTYAGWASNSSGLAMHGIFFDEAPHQFVPEAVEYMHTVGQAVKDANGLQGDKIVVRNPGVVPDTRFNDTNTDITVVFEQSYSVYTDLVKSLVALPGDRSQYSYMINSIPSSVKGNMKKFLREISEFAEFLYVTDNTEAFYESFGAGWDDFVESIPT